ncbi:MAG: phytoene desaturase family protein [Acidimicrobiales bacterium]
MSPGREAFDAVVVGAGPNGLTAAARLARAGRSVLVLERADRIGGGARTASLGDPDVVHDLCSAVHPLGVASPAFGGLDLAGRGLRWAHPAVPLAHPVDDDRVGVLHRGLDATAAGLGADADGWRRMLGPLVRGWDPLVEGFLGPLLPWPRRPVALARFARVGLRSSEALSRRFRGPEAAALLAGCAAHSFLRLDAPFTGGLGLVLAAAAHAVGWPVAVGGSQAIADALAAEVIAHGGEIRCGVEVRALGELPPRRATVLDVTPEQYLALGGRPSWWYRRWRRAPGTCKVDYVLDAPMPWRHEPCRRAGTVHLGGSSADVAAAEAAVLAGRVAPAPFVLVAQPAVADPTRRSADGREPLWAYCHVPNGSPVDASAAIETQFDRFAPGWRDRVRQRWVRTAVDTEAHDPSMPGGDIAGGSLGGLQLLARPRPGLDPWRTPEPATWLCSASTPPGAGVHGMCGWWAAGRVLAADRRRWPTSRP